MTSDIDSVAPPAEPPAPIPSASDGPTSTHFDLLFSAPHGGASEFNLPAAERAPGSPGGPPFGVQRPSRARRRSSRALDWVAFVLAFVVPPLGILAAIAALVVGWQRNGWTSAIAKVAIAVAVTFSLLLGAGGVVFADALSRQATHNALVASSVRFCARVQSSPGLLESSTFDWPAVGDSIDDSIPPMQKYQSFWSNLATVSPKGIRPDVKSIATAAKGIVDSVTKSRVLDDSADISQMQQVVSASGVSEWVAEYCK